jgi:hypothetical protein
LELVGPVGRSPEILSKDGFLPNLEEKLKYDGYFYGILR